MDQNNYIKFFMFSISDMKRKKNAMNKIGRNYIPGKVLVNGIYKQFTEILSNPLDSKFSDAIIIASGDIREIIYKKSRR